MKRNVRTRDPGRSTSLLRAARRLPQLRPSRRLVPDAGAQPRLCWSLLEGGRLVRSGAFFAEQKTLLRNRVQWRSSSARSFRQKTADARAGLSCSGCPSQGNEPRWVANCKGYLTADSNSTRALESLVDCLSRTLGRSPGSVPESFLAGCGIHPTCTPKRHEPLRQRPSAGRGAPRYRILVACALGS